MNQQLSDQRIRSTCRELIRSRGRVSGRGLCAELKRRFGAAGKTIRVFQIWREECASAAVPADVAHLQKRLEAAESTAAENLKRAELAELREQAHQDHWAVEVDRLRQEIAALKGATKPFPV
jgi:hypothetical protein